MQNYVPYRNEGRLEWMKDICIWIGWTQQSSVLLKLLYQCNPSKNNIKLFYIVRQVGIKDHTENKHARKQWKRKSRLEDWEPSLTRH